MTPAMTAVSNTGPFFVRWPLFESASATARGSRRRASASATRCVTGLAPTSTMRGRPSLLRCERRFATSAADVVHLDLRRRGGRLAQACTQLAVAVTAAEPHGADALEELRVACAAAQRIAQARAGGCEKTGIQNAVGGEPRARAAAAKRLRYRGDEANLTAAVDEAVALGDFPAVVALESFERPALADPCQKFLRRHDEIGAPVVAVADVHVLDEAHDHIRAAEVLDEIEHG